MAMGPAADAPRAPARRRLRLHAAGQRRPAATAERPARPADGHRPAELRRRYRRLRRPAADVHPPTVGPGRPGRPGHLELGGRQGLRRNPRRRAGPDRRHSQRHEHRPLPTRRRSPPDDAARVGARRRRRRHGPRRTAGRGEGPRSFRRRRLRTCPARRAVPLHRRRAGRRGARPVPPRPSRRRRRRRTLRLGGLPPGRRSRHVRPGRLLLHLHPRGVQQHAGRGDGLRRRLRRHGRRRQPHPARRRRPARRRPGARRLRRRRRGVPRRPDAARRPARTHRSQLQPWRPSPPTPRPNSSGRSSRPRSGHDTDRLPALPGPQRLDVPGPPDQRVRRRRCLAGEQLPRRRDALPATVAGEPQRRRRRSRPHRGRPQDARVAPRPRGPPAAPARRRDAPFRRRPCTASC